MIGFIKRAKLKKYRFSYVDKPIPFNKEELNQPRTENISDEDPKLFQIMDDYSGETFAPYPNVKPRVGKVKVESAGPG